MHKARAFFYVCVGLFLLALSFHLGARSAGAQVGNILDAAGYSDGWLIAVSGHTPFRAIVTLADGVVHPQPALPEIPGSGSVVVVQSTGRSDSPYVALLADGTVYHFRNEIGAWQFAGNMVGGSTPAQQETWGAMKSRYRGERGATQEQDR